MQLKHVARPLKARQRCWLFCLTLLLSTPATADLGGYESTPGWRDLFNGKNLEGWVPKITGHPLAENYADTFRVQNDLLKVRYDGYEKFANQFGHLFFDEAFSHYVLHIEYRFVGDQAPGGPRGWAVRNSGVMLHSQKPASMILNQEFPNSIEAQFLGGLSDGKARPTANLCTPGTHVSLNNALFKAHCTPSSGATFDGDQWVDFMAIVLGHGRVRHFVNGEEVLSYNNPVLDGAEHSDDAKFKLDRGYLALQSESHPIDFRKVRILSLVGCTDSTSANYQPWAIKSSPGACAARTDTETSDKP